MIKKSDVFRQHHFFEIVRSFDFSKGPIDLFISLYFRHHPQLGSKDRLFIVERIYTFLRWKGLIDAVLPPEKRTEEALLSFLEQDLARYIADETIPLHMRVSFPKDLFDAFVRTFGDEAFAVCRACNEAAPITLRVNTLKTTKEALITALLSHGIEALETLVPTAVVLKKRTNLFVLPEFQAGHFEIQDMGSQMVAACVKALPGESVLDYCAGAGGKALAIAPFMQNKGQLFLHDVRKEVLYEARKRLRRAGIQNAQIVDHSNTRRLNTIRRKMDWVLVDAPCSGTGTLRRNPDMKWKFTQATVDRLVAEQRQIVSEALSFLKPTGTLVFATCSLLKEENDDQVEFFCKEFQLSLLHSPFRSQPIPGGMDGFFAASFKRNNR